MIVVRRGGAEHAALFVEGGPESPARQGETLGSQQQPSMKRAESLA
jgi:hypothetical protein